MLKRKLENFFGSIYYTVMVSGAIFLVTFIPRALLLSKGPFHFDTVDILIEMRDGAVTSHGTYFPLPSLLMIVLAGLKNLLPVKIDDLQLLHFFTAFTSSFASVAVYVLFKRLFTQGFAVIYGLLISFSPVFFSITTFGRIDHALAYVFLAFFIYYALWQKWVQAAIFVALATSCRPESITILAGLLLTILVLFLSDRKRLLRQRLLKAAGTCLSVLFISLSLFMALGWLIGRDKWVHEIILKQANLAGPTDTMPFKGINFVDVLGAIYTLFKIMLVPSLLSIAGFAGEIQGLLKNALFSKDAIRGKNLASFALFFVSFFASFIYVVNVEGSVPRYLALPVFFLIYFSVCGLNFIFKRLKHGGLLKAFFTALACFLCFKFILPIVYARHNDAYCVDYVKAVESITEPNSVIITQDEWVFFKYYTKRETLTPPSGTDPKEWIPFFNKVKMLIVANRPVYLSTAALAYDTSRILTTFMDNNFYTKRVGVYVNESWHGCSISRRFTKEQVFLLIPDIQLINDPSRNTK